MKKSLNKDIASLIDVFKKLNYILDRKQKNLSVIVLLMTVVGAVFETLGVSIIIPLVSSFLSPDLLMENEYIAPVIEIFHITTSGQLLVLISLSVIVIYILKNMYMVLLSYIRVKFSVKVKRELSIKMMNSYMEREYSFFLGVNTADILRGVGYDVSGVQEILFQLFRIMADGLTAMCICIFIIRTDVVMAVSIIVLMGFSLCLLLMVFRNRMKRVGDYYRECTAQVNKYLYEAFQGIKDVIVFHKEPYFVNKYAISFTNQQTAEVAKTIAAESPAYFIEAVFVSGLIIVVGVKIMSGSDTAVFIPQLSAFAIAAFRILPTIGKISAGFNQLIGESGAGKSTMADILLGLLVPDQGDITVDGVSIYEMMDAWKATIGYVPQVVFLTDDTIRHNIAFGVDEKDIDDNKIRLAVEKAQLAETIAALPDGLNTVLGERGTRFSGGQRQRVAIARALYNDPEILILDEATAALDNDTENAVMEAIDALQGYKTLVIIAHRLTTIRNCDEIYEIKDGKAYRKEKEEIFS